MEQSRSGLYTTIAAVILCFLSAKLIPALVLEIVIGVVVACLLGILADYLHFRRAPEGSVLFRPLRNKERAEPLRVSFLFFRYLAYGCVGLLLGRLS